MCCLSIGEVWREESFGSPSFLAFSIALPTVAAVEVLREMRKLDREWIGWSYLSMAPDIFLASSFSLSLRYLTVALFLSSLLYTNTISHIFVDFVDFLCTCFQCRILESDFLRHLSRVKYCGKIGANDDAFANRYKPEQFVCATTTCIWYVFYSIWWITCTAQ